MAVATGGAMIIGPTGNVIAGSIADEETILYGNVPRNHLANAIVLTLRVTIFI